MEAVGLLIGLLRPQLKEANLDKMVQISLMSQLLIYPVVLGVPLFLLAKYLVTNGVSSSIMKVVGWGKSNLVIDVGAAVLGYLLILPIFFGLTLVSQQLFRHFPTPVNPIQLLVIASSTPLQRAMLLISAAIIAPIVEETMFRGVLYPALKQRYGMWNSMLLSGALFASVHPTLPAGFLPLMFMGFAFALSYEIRGTLVCNTIMHGIHNGIIMIQLFAVVGK